MICKLLSSTLTFIIIVCAFALPAFGISLSCSSGDGGGTASSSEGFNLDASTSLKENLVLGSGSISLDRQAAGTGKNSLKQSFSGTGYTLQNDIDSQGVLHASTSSAATPQAASLSQNVGGTGSMSLNLQGVQGATNAGQEASVAEGSLVSAESLSAGQGVSASQSTELAGQGGRVVAGALGKDNVIVANGGFEGFGIMNAHLDSAVLDHATAGGTAALDGVDLLNDDSFKAVSSDDKTRGMGMSGLRVVDGGIGNFDVSILNTNLNAMDGVDHASQVAAVTATSGGSYSSYALTGYRWNQKDPQVQLYLNPTGTPSGLTPESSQSAISAAANTWDDAVSQNIFADGTTVKIDYSKQVPNPFAGSTADTFSVNGWRNFGNSYLGVTAYWTNGQKVNGYYSLTEADTVYNKDYQWTTDLNTAQNTGKLDLQSVAVHELGHSIGMGDLYTLPSSDPRKNDFAQVMNAYDAPQRTLGNGDKTGAQILYGAPSSWQYLGGQIKSNPSTIEDSQGRVHTFAIGGDNALWDNVDGIWHCLGGYLKSDPYVVKDDQGRFHILAIGSDNGLWDKLYDTKSGSSDWYGLGGYITSDASAAVEPSANGLLKVAVRGSDGSLWVNDLNTQYMTGVWNPLGGYIKSNPSVVFDAQGKMHIFVRGGDDSLWDNVGISSAGKYSYEWKTLSGGITSVSNPLVDPDDRSRIDVFARGNDGSLWENELDTNSFVGDWHNLDVFISPSGSGGSISEGNSKPVIDSDGNVNIFFRGIDGSLWDCVKSSTGSLQKYDLGGQLTSDPSAILNSNKQLQIAVRWSDNSLYSELN